LPKIYTGAPSFNWEGSGYQDLEGFTRAITQVKEIGLYNFGGIMSWDGSEALFNKNQGIDYLTGAKNAIDG
jgi:hypothetical protein